MEFFRTKNKFNREWRVKEQMISEIVMKAKDEMKTYENRIVYLLQIQPMILECLNLMNSYSVADLNARKELAFCLSLSNLPSEGYLLVDKLKSDQLKAEQSRPTTTKPTKPGSTDKLTR